MLKPCWKYVCCEIAVECAAVIVRWLNWSQVAVDRLEENVCWRMEKPQSSKPSYIIDIFQIPVYQQILNLIHVCEDGVSTFLRNVRKIIILHSVRTPKTLIWGNNIFLVNNRIIIFLCLFFFHISVCFPRRHIFTPRYVL
jgi:hypothetical protein